MNNIYLKTKIQFLSHKLLEMELENDAFFLACKYLVRLKVITQNKIEKEVFPSFHVVVFSESVNHRTFLLLTLRKWVSVGWYRNL